LTVKGDVRFESNVAIRGKIVITNKGKTQAVIKEGTVEEKDLIFD
jgi:cytoskeletal protein CcmA (bactofilin family)